MEVLGALKVKDGLFLGDEFAAQDLEFLVANKVTRVVNCAAHQIPNHWEPIGVLYFSFYWTESDTQTLFDKKSAVSGVHKFIEDSVQLGESVLIHSVRGRNRCICVLTAYFMRKYK